MVLRVGGGKKGGVLRGEAGVRLWGEGVMVPLVLGF